MEKWTFIHPDFTWTAYTCHTCYYRSFIDHQLEDVLNLFNATREDNEHTTQNMVFRDWDDKFFVHYVTIRDDIHTVTIIPDVKYRDTARDFHQMVEDDFRKNLFSLRTRGHLIHFASMEEVKQALQSAKHFDSLGGVKTRAEIAAWIDSKE